MRRSICGGGVKVLAIGGAILAGLMGGVSVHAQKAYSYSVLKPSTSGSHWSPDSRVIVLDAGDRAYATTEYFSRYAFSWDPFGFVALTDFYLSTWAPGTAANVAPTKYLAQKGASISRATPDGTKALVSVPSSVGYRLYDLSTKAPVSSAVYPTSSRYVAINNRGDTIETFADETSGGAYGPWRAMFRAAGQTAVMLPLGGAGASRAIGLNASGTVVGEVSQVPDGHLQGAWWVNGQLNLLPTPANEASSIVGINDQGQMLVLRWPIDSCHVSSNLPPIRACTNGRGKLYLREGQAETFLAGDGTNLAEPLSATIDNAGVVLIETYDHDDARRSWTSAGILRWQAGNIAELGAYLRGKGAMLPASYKINRVVARNSKGSMLLIVSDGGKTFGGLLARMTATP